jgi:P4 family phage/plasmid primase-like protien
MREGYTARQGELRWDPPLPPPVAGSKFAPAKFADYILRSDPTRPWISWPVEPRSGIGLDLRRYRDGVYVRAEDEFRSAFRTIFEDKYFPKQADECVRTAKEISSTKETDLSAESLICVRNGLLDWRTGELRPHDPALRRTWQIPVSWNQGTTSTVLDGFLAATFPDEGDRKLFLEIAGYCLLPANPYQTFFLFIGGGANGKGVALRTLRSLLGEQNVRSVSLTDLDPSRNRFMAAELHGSLANLVGDLGAVTVSDSATLKKLTGGDTLTAERKGESPFQFVYGGKLIFGCNEFPRILDTSYGMLRRIRVLPFTETFEAGMPGYDPDIDQKLRSPEALTALLAKAVSALRDLVTRHEFTQSTGAIRAKEDYRKANDSAYEYCVSHLAFDQAEEWLPKSKVYPEYAKWCREQDLRPVSQRDFNSKLRKLGAGEGHRTVGQDERQRAWTGVRWRVVADDDPD